MSKMKRLIRRHEGMPKAVIMSEGWAGTTATMTETELWKGRKILEPFLDLCVSSLREGHANLLCIVPILTDVAEATDCNLNF